MRSRQICPLSGGLLELIDILAGNTQFDYNYYRITEFPKQHRFWSTFIVLMIDFLPIEVQKKTYRNALAKRLPICSVALRNGSLSRCA